MNQRGYRRDRGLAPLREDLAAALLMLARYDARHDVLIDPMAGTGTIAIEAASMARGLPVWVAPRAPLVDRLPRLRELASRPAPPLFGDTNPHIFASDVHPDLAGVAAEGAEAAGVAASIQIATSDFRDLTKRRIRERLGLAQLERGVILCNPPYGERMSAHELDLLYADLGRFCAGFAGLRAAFLVANPEFERAFGGRPRIKKPLSIGPLRGYFYLYDI